MTIITKYVAIDGTEYFDERSCVVHECYLKRQDAEEYVESHNYNSRLGAVYYIEDLITYNGLDECAWSGYIVKLDTDMARAVATLTNEKTIEVTNKLAFLETDGSEWYLIPSLSKFINSIRSSINAIESLILEEEE